MKTLFLFLLLLTPAIGQTTEYDKFKDVTHVYIYKPGTPSIIWSFKYQGQTLTKDADTFYLYFNGGHNCRGFCFNDPSLILLIDGKRFDLSDGKDRLSDSAIWQIDRATMEAVVNAKLVEYQVGHFEGKWQGDLKDLKTLFDLATVKHLTKATGGN